MFETLIVWLIGVYTSSVNFVLLILTSIRIGYQILFALFFRLLTGLILISVHIILFMDVFLSTPGIMKFGVGP